MSLIPLDNTFWLALVRSLGWQSAVVVTAAWTASAFVKSIFWRRTAWQIATICLLFVAVEELTGARRAVAVFLGGKPKVERTFSTKVLGKQTPVVSEEVNPADWTEASNVTINEVKAAEPSVVFWPGLLWAAGLIVIATRILFSQGLFLLIRSRNGGSEQNLKASVQSIATRIGIRRTIVLRESTGLKSPIAFGVIWPTIALPSGFSDRFSQQQRDAMLTHEVAHLASHDPAWYLLADIVIALFWWNPMAWFARRQLHAASEAAADEAALLLENGPDTLAECLVTLAQTFSSRKGFGWLGVEGNGFRSNLGQRVHRLLSLETNDWQWPRRGRFLTAKILTPLLFLALVVLCGAWEQKDETRPKNLSASVRQSWNDSPLLLALNSVSSAPDEPTTPTHTTVSVRSPAPANKTDSSIMISARSLRAPAVEGKGLIDELADNVATNAVLSEEQTKLLLMLVSYRKEVETLGMPRAIVLPGAQSELAVSRPITNGTTVTSEEITVKVVAKREGTNCQLSLKFLAGTFSSDGKPIDNSGIALDKNITLGLDQTAVISRSNLSTDYIVLITARPVSAEELQSIFSKGKTNSRAAVDATATQATADDGQLLYLMGKFDEAKTKFNEVLKLDPQNAAANYYLKLIEERRQRIVATNEYSHGSDLYYPTLPMRRVKESSKVEPSPQRTNQVYTSPKLKETLEKLQSIRVNKIDWKGVSLTHAVEELARIIHLEHEEKGTAFFLVSTNGPRTITLSLTNVTVVTVLESIIRAPNIPPLKFSIQEAGVIISDGQPSDKLFNRVFRIDPNAVVKALTDSNFYNPTNSYSAGRFAINGKTGLAGNARTNYIAPINEAFRNYLGSKGIDITPPKHVFFNDRLGQILVRATQEDLETIAGLIQSMDAAPAQVTIEVKYVEIDKSTAQKLKLEYLLRPQNHAHSIGAPNTGLSGKTPILTDPQYRSILRTLENEKGVDILTAPRVTTLSGREAQISSLDPVPGATGAASIPFDASLDIVPYVSADRFAIDLTLIPTIGRVLQAITKTTIWDGQTAVLTGIPSPTSDAQGKPQTDKTIFIFVSATVIDAAGNRVNSDESMPFAQTSVPPGPPEVQRARERAK